MQQGRFTHAHKVPLQLRTTSCFCFGAAGSYKGEAPALWACNGKPCKTCTLQGCRSDTDACKTCKKEGEYCQKNLDCCGNLCGKGMCLKGYKTKPDLISCDQSGTSAAAVCSPRIVMHPDRTELTSLWVLSSVVYVHDVGV